MFDASMDLDGDSGGAVEDGEYIHIMEECCDSIDDPWWHVDFVDECEEEVVVDGVESFSSVEEEDESRVLVAKSIIVEVV